MEPEQTAPQSYPVAICKTNWQVLFNNGDVFPVHNFVDHDGRMLHDEKGARGMMFIGPGERWYFCELDDDALDVMSLH